MRLAWFSPMPPVRTGVSVDSRELLAGLGAEHEIEVFVDDPVVDAARRMQPVPRSTAIYPAHDFVWRRERRPYDLTVYQLGNSAHHDYQWPYLFRYPGLVALHDAHLHHSRAAALLGRRRTADYRAEFAANEPDTSVDAAELAIAGFDSSLHYYWPFTRLVLQASKLTLVHSRAVLEDLESTVPGARVEYVRLGHGIPVEPADIDRRGRAARGRLGIPAGAVVFGCFGGLSADKRLPQILDALVEILPDLPAARLLLGGAAPPHYDLGAEIARRGLQAQVVSTGYVETDEELTDLIAASDVTLHLRWPTARELSGPWLRSLAAGRCSIVSALAHTADIPMLHADSWAPTVGDGRPPVAVAVDLVHEAATLPAALRRLAGNAALRERLGREARRFWQAEHSPAVMVEDYRRILAGAAELPTPAPALPSHLTGDHSALATSILGRFGVPVPWSRI